MDENKKRSQIWQEQQIDPGVLRIFRIFVALQWVAQTVFLLILRRRMELDSVTIFNWVLSCTYCVYLTWSWLQHRMGKYYFPVILFVASIGPIISQIAVTALWLQGGATGRYIQMLYPLKDYGGQLLPLMLPLLLISTQYNLRVLFCFTLGITALSMIQVYLLASSDLLTMVVTFLQVVARFFFLSFSGMVIAFLSAEKRKQQYDLKQKNERISHYAVTLEQLAISHERNRIARELHDTLAHTLSGLNVQLKALDVLWDSNSQQAGTMIKQMQHATHEGLQEVRNALQALRARPLEDLGLVQALKQLAQQNAAWATLDLKLQLPARVIGLSHEVELQLYRVAEEALHNVARHAHATHVSLMLQQDQTGFQLVISDDGRGFDASMQATGSHYGLTGMRERAALIDAHVEVRSQPGKGTSVRLWKEKA
jgi:signal transduction histidine kinase